jgi:hypothetical protein
MPDMRNVESTDINEQRLALFTGIVFLWLVLHGLANALFFPGIPSGLYADAVRTVAASPWQYRLGSADLLFNTLTGVLLEFGLYGLLKRVNAQLSLLGLLFMFQDSCIGGVLRGLGFARIELYTAPAAAGKLPDQNSAELIRFVGDYIEKVGGICFGLGLLLFFFVFLRSMYLPRLLSLFGLTASAIWIGFYFLILLRPEYRATLQYSAFALLLVTSIPSSVFLVRFGLNGER